MTGVKGFQYKQRNTYELRVYVDDGSLISEVLIDHDAGRTKRNRVLPSGGFKRSGFFRLQVGDIYEGNIKTVPDIPS